MRYMSVLSVPLLALLFLQLRLHRSAPGIKRVITAAFDRVVPGQQQV